jgi:hypothetical protein
VPALFATFLLVSLALACAIAFSNEHTRRPLKWILILTLLCAWGALGLAISRIVARTGSTLVTPGGVQQPHLIEQAVREALMLVVSLGGPALLATGLGWLSLRATRRQPKDTAGHEQAPPG